jgi:hypothetical protein
MAVAISYGFGKHTSDIPNGVPGIITVSNRILGCWITGVLTSGFARISIACLLLSITSSRRWRILLWCTVALQAVLMLSYVVVQFVQCKSNLDNKTRVGGSSSQCLGRTQVLVFSFVSVSVCMISDLICSVVPLFIVWRLSRSTLEKTLVLLLMTSCLLATVFGIPKIYRLVIYDFDTKDGLWELIPEFFWFEMEVGTIIIAACAPLLKAPIERCMRRAGLPTFGVPMRDLNRVSSVALGSKVGWEEGGGRRWMGSGSETEGGLSLGTTVVTVNGGDEESRGDMDEENKERRELGEERVAKEGGRKAGSTEDTRPTTQTTMASTAASTTAAATSTVALAADKGGS